MATTLMCAHMKCLHSTVECIKCCVSIKFSGNVWQLVHMINVNAYPQASRCHIQLAWIVSVHGMVTSTQLFWLVCAGGQELLGGRPQHSEGGGLWFGSVCSG